MSRIAKILFPIDFSPSCRAMAAYVKRSAALFEASVTLVHVLDAGALDLAEQYETYVRPVSEILEERRAIREERLSAFLKDGFPSPASQRVLLSGDPATEISKFAKEEKFDLIIMPTHSGRFRQMLLGSTTAKVINDTDCPVLTSTHAEAIAPRTLGHREWLCAVGLSSDSERVLRYADAVAREVHAKLTIIHALQVGESELPIELALEEQVQSAEKREALERIADLLRLVGSDATVRIAAGQVKKALLEAAVLSDADVLIIGRSPHSGAQGRMRDLTYAVIRDSPFPVLSV